MKELPPPERGNSPLGQQVYTKQLLLGPGESSDSPFVPRTDQYGSPTFIRDSMSQNGKKNKVGGLAGRIAVFAPGDLDSKILLEKFL